MIKCNRKKCKTLFTISCTICVAVMVGYWFYKYDVEDRDIGVVDYDPLSHAEDIPFPAVSLCIRDPFLFRKLKSIDGNITKKLYRKYLEGEIFDRIFEQTDYANMTLNLDQYFLNAYIYLQNGTKLHEPYDSSAIQHTETFSGFINSDFVKCFMMICT